MDEVPVEGEGISGGAEETDVKVETTELGVPDLTVLPLPPPELALSNLPTKAPTPAPSTSVPLRGGSLNGPPCLIRRKASSTLGAEVGEKGSVREERGEDDCGCDPEDALSR